MPKHHNACAKWNSCTETLQKVTTLLFSFTTTTKNYLYHLQQHTHHYHTNSMIYEVFPSCTYDFLGSEQKTVRPTIRGCRIICATEWHVLFGERYAPPRWRVHVIFVHFRGEFHDFATEAPQSVYFTIYGIFLKPEGWCIFFSFLLFGLFVCF